MKKTFTIFFPITIGILLTAGVFAQVPEKMSYQAVVRNSSDALVTNTQIGMQISILQGSATGTSVYVETQAPTTNDNGLISIEIGGGTIVSGDFTTIDWTNGPYFIKTETDPAGGTNYTITGTSQLLSVPYALHAKTADAVTGGINETDPLFSAWDKTTGIWLTESQISDLGTYVETETDPVYGSSVASGITATDTTNWNNKLDSETDPVFGLSVASGITGTDTTNWNNKLDSEADPEFSAWDKSTGISITESQISDLDHFTTADETDPRVPVGTRAGQIQYWNGSAWVTVERGSTGQVLIFVDGKPTWGVIPSAGAGDVQNPTTGAIWMDRNLGASRVATSSTDAASYGDLYQWGRDADGHESRTSGETSTLSSNDVPGHSQFITIHGDWRSPQNHNLWQGVTGINNPCPNGYRLPTIAELDAERLSWTSNNAAGAFASPLKLTLAGLRYTTGSIFNVGLYGDYWSSTISGTSSQVLYFTSGDSNVGSTERAHGFSVRCLLD